MVTSPLELNCISTSICVCTIAFPSAHYLCSMYVCAWVCCVLFVSLWFNIPLCALIDRVWYIVVARSCASSSNLEQPNALQLSNAVSFQFFFVAAVVVGVIVDSLDVSALRFFFFLLHLFLPLLAVFGINGNKMSMLLHAAAVNKPASEADNELRAEQFTFKKIMNLHMYYEWLAGWLAGWMSHLPIVFSLVLRHRVCSWLVHHIPISSLIGASKCDAKHRVIQRENLFFICVSMALLSLPFAVWLHVCAVWIMLHYRTIGLRHDTHYLAGGEWSKEERERWNQNEAKKIFIYYFSKIAPGSTR